MNTELSSDLSDGRHEKSMRFLLFLWSGTQPHEPLVDWNQAFRDLFLDAPLGDNAGDSRNPFILVHGKPPFDSNTKDTLRAMY